MKKNLISNSRGIAADHHSLRVDSFTGYCKSAFRPSAVPVPGMSPEGHPHMQKNIKSDSRGITARNHSHVDPEFTSRVLVKAQYSTEELSSRESDDQ